ncbi:hypothetical protein CK501_16190 [Halovibrio salipaludis]|uniref:MSHA pilin protein MshA n=1 Tax=Halovibrio salipaludis TaxID=2032626 RepID=A0A2A2EUY5_9GAMM|nr:prepilin-type N-terminal cleavage/methylation domain-containing protein [Halovibrio salipaludis]PAU76370.1 hypothetical protein CK501_16190 [Halovibrio salipaludis]
MQRQQQGFTLIELVIVIVILGILSAFALPRFADLGGDAREATRDGIVGAMKSASSIAHSKCLTSSDCEASADESTVSLENQTIQMVYGYPDSIADGIGQAAQIDAPTASAGTSGGTITYNVDDSADCQITYTAASEDTDTGEISSPSVATSGDCN